MKNIFISSTFRDMQAERDLVQERVLPALRAEARKHGDNVGVIDLRWGVDTSTLETDEGSAKVLTVCLDEIDRSHPYMLIFIGERYGWIPDSKLIEKAVRDRVDKYVTDDFEKSVTALEIEYGALSEQYGDLNHCIVCFRESVTAGMDKETREVYAEQEEKGIQKLRVLKERIKRELGSDARLITYTCNWDESAKSLVGFYVNGEPLETVLTERFVEMFHADWKKYETLSWQEKEQLAFHALMESKLRSFVGREELLEEYYQEITESFLPIIIRGEVGSGKTAIMSKLVERLNVEGKKVFSFFAGAGTSSGSAEMLVKQMVYYLETELGIEDRFEEKRPYEDWVERFRGLCCLTWDNEMYFCIDALDQLYVDAYKEKLDFIVTNEKIKMILSCTNSFNASMSTMLACKMLSVPVLSKMDAAKVAEEILASYSRNAYDRIMHEIFEKKSTGNPLYISLLIQRLNMMDANELYEAKTEQEIIELGVKLVQDMPEESEDAVVALVKCAIDKVCTNGDMLQDIINYLAVSRNGLRVSDLKSIFWEKGQFFQDLELSLLMKYLDGFFCIHEENRIDFTHGIIRKGILRNINNRDKYEWQIKEHLRKLDEGDPLRIHEGMYYARRLRDYEFAKQLIFVTETNYDNFVMAHMSSDKSIDDYGKTKLLKAIKEEASADASEFYCELIENGTDKYVISFLESKIVPIFGLSKRDIKAKSALLKKIVEKHEEEYKNRTNRYSSEIEYNLYSEEEDLKKLVDSCKYLVGTLEDNNETGLEVYLEKKIKYEREWCIKKQNRECARVLASCNKEMWQLVQNNIGIEEVLVKYEEKIKEKEEWYEEGRSETTLIELMEDYKNIGKIMCILERKNKELKFCRKRLECAEKLNARMDNMSTLRELWESSLKAGEMVEKYKGGKESLKYYRIALVNAERMCEREKTCDNLLRLYSCNNHMADLQRRMKNYEDALEYSGKGVECVESAVEICSNAKSEYMLAKAYLESGNAMAAVQKYEEAVVCYDKALVRLDMIVESEEILEQIANLHFLKGMSFQNLEKEQEALVCYKSAEELMEKVNKTSVPAKKMLEALEITHFQISKVYHSLKEYGKAWEYCEKCITESEQVYAKSQKSGDYRYLAERHEFLGYILYASERYEEAVVYFKKSLFRRASWWKIAEITVENMKKEASGVAEGFNSQKRIVHNIIQILLDKLKKYGEAKEWAEINLKSGRQMASAFGKIHLLPELLLYAHVHCESDNIVEAQNAYEEALGCSRELYVKGDISTGKYYIHALKGVGDCLIKQGKEEEAQEYFSKAKEETVKLCGQLENEERKKLLESLS